MSFAPCWQVLQHILLRVRKHFVAGAASHFGAIEPCLHMKPCDAKAHTVPQCIMLVSFASSIPSRPPRRKHLAATAKDQIPLTPTQHAQHKACMLCMDHNHHAMLHNQANCTAATDICQTASPDLSVRCIPCDTAEIAPCDAFQQQQRNLSIRGQLLSDMSGAHSAAPRQVPPSCVPVCRLAAFMRPFWCGLRTPQAPPHRSPPG